MSPAGTGVPAPMPQTGYKVTAQVPTMQLGADGKPTEGINITITTGRGHTATQFVPRTQYRVETVRPLLDELAGHLDAVGDLGGLS